VDILLEVVRKVFNLRGFLWRRCIGFWSQACIDLSFISHGVYEYFNHRERPYLNQDSSCDSYVTPYEYVVALEGVEEEAGR